MPSYEQADDSVHVMALSVMFAHHSELRFQGRDGEADYPRLCILMAHSDEEGEPAVKCHGYPAAAVISVIPIKQRVDKRADAEIVIDAANWEDLDEPKRRALLDHEITHLEIKTDKHGAVEVDDVGRPKLKLRLHDFDFGGFRSIARRYGEDAPEVIAARHFREDFGQDVLPEQPAKRESGLPFRLNKETVEGPFREHFGSQVVSVEDTEHGVEVTVNTGR